MGRSRITRTFHNKPTSKKKDISNKSQSVSKMTKQKASSTQASPTQVKSKTEIAYKQKYVKRNTGNTRLLYKKRDENIRRPLPGEVKNSPSIILPQAHAQEATHMDQKRGFNPPFTTGKDGRPTGGTDAGVIETIKRSKTGYNVSGPGGSNDKTMYMNMDSDDLSTYGGISGQKSLPPKTVYKAKNKAKAIKQQRNWHTPFTSFGQGMGNQAHDIGGSVHGLVTGQGYQVKSVLNRAVDHAFAGDWDSAGSVISDNPYRFAGNVVTEVGLAVIPFGLVARGAGIAGRVGGAATKVLSKTKSTKSGKYPGLEKKLKDKKYAGLKKKLSDSKVQGGRDQRHGQVHRQLDAPKSSGINTGARLPKETLFGGKKGFGGNISKHNQPKYPDQAFLTWGESPILRSLGGYEVTTKPGIFAAARASGKNIGKSSVSRKQLNELETTGKTQNLGKGRKWVTSPFDVKYENI